jgi:Zn-dependent protease with chaperone function
LASDEEAIAEGNWYLANSNRFVAARLVSRGVDMTVLAEDGAVLSVGTVPAVSFSSRVGSIPRRVTFPDGSVFETGDNEGIDAYFRSNGKSDVSRVHRLEELRPRLLLFTLAVFILGAGIYRYALPAIVEVAVIVTPPVVPKLMSSSTIQTLDGAFFKRSELSVDEQRSIEEEFNRVAAHAAGGAKAYALNFRSGSMIGPNAFALPDGNIFIMDDLVDLADGDDELIIAALAHEIGHVERKHTLRRIYRAAGLVGIIMLIAGDVGSGVEDVLTQGGGLLALSYSRSDEAEADRRSVDLMRSSGLDPTAIARFFDLVMDELGDHSATSMFSTHPGTPERKKTVLQYAAQSH